MKDYDHLDPDFMKEIRKEAETILQRRKERYMQLLKKDPDSILVLRQIGPRWRRVRTRRSK